jgi:alkylhydroperoxidase family enzyme
LTAPAVPANIAVVKSRFAERVQALKEAVLSSPGALDRGAREAAAAGRVSDLRGPAGGYVDKVRKHAYKVTEEEIAELRRAGYTDDEIFELTVSAALGAGLERLERGLRALQGGGGDHAT